MLDQDRIANRLLDWESLDEERPDDPAALYPGDDEEAVELRRRAELLRRFDDAFGLSNRTLVYESSAEPTVGFRSRYPDVPGCRIQGVLGRGGMGIVYRAWQEHLEREVAVKVLRGTAGDTAARNRRFAREARVLAKLRHDHIVPVYEAAPPGGEPYFVMELMTGGSLAGAIQRFSEPRAAASIVERVARAVQHAHAQDILHRDLKPANILLDEHSRPRVSDFGLAKLIDADEEPTDRRDEESLAETPDRYAAARATSTNAVVGTPLYMAPEQFSPTERVGPAVDIWALGVILYELLTEKRPFGPHSPGGLMRAIQTVEPPRPRTLRPRIPAALEAIVLKCLAKEPAARYADAGALADDLRRWLDGEAPSVYPDGRAHALYRLIRRRSTAAVLVAAGIVGAIIALSAAIIAYKNDPERIRESLAESLAAGRPAPLLAALGPPRVRRVALGAESTHQSRETDRPFFISTHGAALVELWSNPPPSYRFEVEVRHEDNPGEGRIGVFFDHEPIHSAIGLPCCFTVAYSDRGDNARRAPLPDGTPANRVMLSLRYFELGPQVEQFDHEHRIDSRISHIPAPIQPGPSPWRKLRLDVDAKRIAISWTPGEGLPDQWIEVAEASIQSQARLAGLAIPELRNYRGRSAARGSLGLYVSRSAASFRNAVLQPLSETP